MKKNILLNLSCLCVLFGGINIAECEAMNKKKIDLLSIHKSLQRANVRTIKQVCDFSALSREFSVKESFKQQFSKADNILSKDLVDLNSKYKEDIGFRNKINKEFNVRANLPEVKQEEEQRGEETGDMEHQGDNGQKEDIEFQNEINKEFNVRANLAEVKQEEERRDEETGDMEHQGDNEQNVLNVNIDSIIPEYNIRQGVKLLGGSTDEAQQQAAAYVLKNSVDLADDEIIMLVAAAQGRIAKLYQNKTNKEVGIEEDEFALFIYGLENVENPQVFGVTQTKDVIDEDTEITVKDNQLIPDAIIERISIDKKTALEYMRKKFKENHLNAYELSDEAKKKIENQTTLNGKLEALGLAEKTN